MATGVKISPDVFMQILERDSHGMSQLQIAKELGLSHYTICRILKRVHAKVWARIIEDLATVKSRHIVRLEHAAMLAMDAFTKTEKPIAQFLAVYIAALSDIRDILGLPNQIVMSATDDPACGSDAVTQSLVRLQEMLREQTESSQLALPCNGSHNGHTTPNGEESITSPDDLEVGYDAEADN
jgi:transcriptional regulator with XRE-family HTH domain